MNCEICGKKAYSNRCFKHKNRKSLKTNKKEKDSPDKMWEFFLSIWRKRKHYCENCNIYLGNTPYSYNFDHILEKSKYPELKYEEENICILCLKCHDEKTRGFVSEFLRNKIKSTKQFYEKGSD